MTIESIFRALKFASGKHRDQRRKDIEASPYINHPIDVAQILAVEGGVTDETTLLAAILHDTLEDTETTVDELRSLFGDKVTDIVIELTDDQSIPRAERYELQKHKAVLYSPEARLIRLADKISNIRDATASPPPKWSPERLQGHKDHAAAVVTILRSTHQKLEELFDLALGANDRKD